MSARGVRALFLFPQQYHHTLGDWCVDRLLGPLAEKKVPVFICPNTLLSEGAADQSDWDGIVRVCRAFPELPVIVAEARILCTPRTMYQALDACPNLYIDLSALWTHRAVEFVCRNWGAERLLFGTGLPRRDPAAVLGQLVYSEIAPAELAAIAAGTLRRLLSWNAQRPLPRADVAFPEPIDELHALVRDREPLEGQGFVCGHGHLGPHTHTHIIDGSPSQLVAEMDRLGVARGIVFADGGMNSDEVYGNDRVAATIAAFPERFVGLVTVNLHRSHDEMTREMERGFEMGMKGVKIHPYLSGYDTNGANVDFVCAFVNERRGFVLNHDWGDTDRILGLCREYPNACFMTGHTSPHAYPAIKEVDNLYVGSCPLLGFRQTEAVVDDIGADRLLFGSDLSWAPIGWGLGPVLCAQIPAEDKRRILGGNTLRLLQQYGMRGAQGER
jgi:predicted TIM-barrel fold metal-dependent hydrolase